MLTECCPEVHRHCWQLLCRSLLQGVSVHPTAQSISRLHLRQNRELHERETNVPLNREARWKNESKLTMRAEISLLSNLAYVYYYLCSFIAHCLLALGTRVTSAPALISCLAAARPAAPAPIIHTRGLSRATWSPITK
jgi:hypothetical protein